jgi:WD40 repeat protein
VRLPIAEGLFVMGGAGSTNGRWLAVTVLDAGAMSAAAGSRDQPSALQLKALRPRIELFDLEVKDRWEKKEIVPPSYPHYIDFSPDGQWLLVACLEEDSLYLWETGAVSVAPRKLTLPQRVSSFDRFGSSLLGSLIAVYQPDGGISILNYLDPQQRPVSLQGSPRQRASRKDLICKHDLVFSHDNRYLAMVREADDEGGFTDEGVFLIWDVNKPARPLLQQSVREAPQAVEKGQDSRICACPFPKDRPVFESLIGSGAKLAWNLDGADTTCVVEGRLSHESGSLLAAVASPRGDVSRAVTIPVNAGQALYWPSTRSGTQPIAFDRLVGSMVLQVWFAGPRVVVLRPLTPANEVRCCFLRKDMPASPTYQVSLGWVMPSQGMGGEVAKVVQSSPLSGGLRDIAVDQAGERLVGAIATMALGGGTARVPLWRISDPNGSPAPDSPACSVSLAQFLQQTSSKTAGPDSLSRNGAGAGKGMSSFGVEAVAFSPDGRLIAAGVQQTLCLWLADDPGMVPVHFEKHEAPISALAFLPASGQKQFTLVTSDLKGVIKRWDFQEKADVQTRDLYGHSSGISALALSDDGHKLAFGGDDGRIAVFDPDGAEPRVDPVQAHQGHVNGVALSPGGDRLACAGNDGKVTLWSCDGPRLERELTELSGTPRGVLFDRSGQFLLVGTGAPWTAATFHGTGDVKLQDGAVWVVDLREGRRRSSPV